MTKLQQDILDSFEDLAGDQKDMAIAAAEVAMKYIQKSIWHFYLKNRHPYPENIALVNEQVDKFYAEEEKWLKDNGIL